MRIFDFISRISRHAFEDTYTENTSRCIDDQKPYASAFSAFIGSQNKFQTGLLGVELFKDRNLYNWLEQLVFFVPRIAKNIIKLATEFVPNLVTETLVSISDELEDLADDYPDHSGMSVTLTFLSYVFHSLSFAPWLLSKLGQSITSPFAAMKGSANYIEGLTGSSMLGTLAGGVRGLVSVGLYASMAIFAAPVLTVYLINSGNLGAHLFLALNKAVAWTAHLPVLSTVGTIFATKVAAIGSMFGLQLTAGLAAASAITTAIMAYVPALAVLKALVRKLSPWEHAPVRDQSSDLSPSRNSYQNQSTQNFAPAPYLQQQSLSLVPPSQRHSTNNLVQSSLHQSTTATTGPLLRRQSNPRLNEPTPSTGSSTRTLHSRTNTATPNFLSSTTQSASNNNNNNINISTASSSPALPRKRSQ